MSKKIFLWPALLLIAGAVTAFVFVSTRSSVRRPAVQKLLQEPINNNRLSPERVQAGALWPQMRRYLKAFGDRLERPAKERLILGGMLERIGEPPVAFAAISEFPDRLRLTIQSRDQARTIIYDGQTARVIGGNLTQADEGLIESVVNDTAEHFFLTQMQGAPTRHLGDRFRADDGSATNYAGPFQDVFWVLNNFKMGSEIRSQYKVYYFDSDSHLLEKVTYQISRNGEPVEVETRFSAWHSVEGQQVPRGVARLENGQQVMSLTINSVAIGPRLNDFF